MSQCRRYLRRLLQWSVVAGMGFAVLLATVPVVSAAPKPDADGIRNLASCYAERGKMAVQFLMDQSGSLKDTDPQATRVEFARAVVQALSAVSVIPVNGGLGRIDAQVVAFGSQTEEVIGWETIGPETADKISRELGQFKDRNRARGTDYVDALTQAQIAVLSRSSEIDPQNPGSVCRAVVWFTDGEFDLDIDGSSRGWAPEIPLTSKARKNEAVEAGKKVLCNSGGLADQYRSSETYLLTAALLTGSFNGDLLRRVTVGDGDCGSIPGGPTGSFFGSDDLGGLIPKILGPIITPPPLVPPDPVAGTCSATDCVARFEVDASTIAAVVLVDSEPVGGAMMLVGPNGDLLDITEQTVNGKIAGAPVSSRAQGSWRVLTVDLAKSPNAAVGTWSVSVSPPGGTDVFQIYPSRKTGIGIKPNATTPWTRGQLGEVTFKIVNSAGKSLDPLAVSSSQVSAKIGHGASPAQDIPAAWDPTSGNLVAEYTPSIDEAASEALVALSGTITNAAGDIIPVFSSAKIPVRVAGAPSVDSVLNLGVVKAPRNKERDSEGRQVVLPVTLPRDLGAEGAEDSNGEVCLGKDSKITLADQAVSVSAAGDSCVPVTAGKAAALPLLFSVENPQAGRFNGTINLTLKSDLQDKASRISVPVSGDLFVEPGDPVTNRTTLSLLVVGSLLAAALLWVLLSWRTAYFKDVVEIRGFMVANAVISRASANFAIPEFRADGWKFLEPSGPRGANFDPGGADLQFKAPVRILAAQDAKVGRAGYLAHGPLGGAGDEARIGHQIQGQWVFTVAPSEVDLESGLIEGDLFFFIIDGAGPEFSPSGVLQRAHQELLDHFERLHERIAKSREEHESPPDFEDFDAGPEEDPFAVKVD
jgi:hypothetical protein